MEIKVFTEIIREELEKRIGLEVRAQEVRKNNNVILHGINITEKDSNISPVIYMESYHEAYEQGTEFSEIAEQIYKVYQREKLGDSFDVKWFRDWENVKGQVAYKLINYVENVELLESIPHERFLDLVKVYYVSVNSEKLGKGTILIHNSHLDMWGVSSEQLGAVADENTPKLFPVEVKSMCDMIIELGFPYMEECEAFPKMYVMSNNVRVLGAATMCYGDAIKDFAKEVDSDIIILPSSLHELILVPLKADIVVEAFKSMVYEVNRTQVVDEEVLSDSVYIYRRKDNFVEIV